MRKVKQDTQQYNLIGDHWNGTLAVHENSKHATMLITCKEMFSKITQTAYNSCWGNDITNILYNGCQGHQYILQWLSRSPVHYTLVVNATSTLYNGCQSQQHIIQKWLSKLPILTTYVKNMMQTIALIFIIAITPTDKTHSIPDTKQQV